MSYYRVCPGCRANLDPGEICEDCRDKERSARAANTDAPQSKDMESINSTTAFFKNQTEANDR